MKTSIYYLGVIFLALAGMSACSYEDAKPSSPKETFMTYTKAVKAKDITTMKLLLSAETMKMNEMEAQARGVPIDEVVKNETLFAENQKTVKIRNEKIEGETATLEVENTFGTWETVPFVREQGEWKIDKKGFAQRLMDEVNQGSQDLDNKINELRQQQP